MYSLTINGFKSKEAVNCFWLWYQEQGEQDIQVWWEIMANGTIGELPLSSNKVRWEGKNKICQIKQ